MASDLLAIQIVNLTSRDRRFILFQSNAVQAANEANTLYVWESRLLEQQGGQAFIALPIPFTVAGMSGEPPQYSLSASKPGQYGQCWSLQQASPEDLLKLLPCSDAASDPASVTVENRVTFARRSGVILKDGRLLFGAEIVPNLKALYRIASSFWVALSDLRRGDRILQPPPASQSCEVPYEVPSAVTDYIVTLSEKTATGELVFGVEKKITPKFLRA